MNYYQQQIYHFNMNREEHLMKTFPLKDGTTYIQSIDKSFICEYSGLPSVHTYEPKGAGVGGESLEENFIDSASIELGKSVEHKSSDWMYNWIREKSGK